MRCTIALALALLSAGCATQRAAPLGPPPGNSGSISYLSVIDGNAIYPIPDSRHVHLDEFSTASYTLSNRGEAVNGQLSVRFSRDIIGTLESKASGQNFMLTFKAISDSWKTDPPGYEKAFTGSAFSGLVGTMTMDPLGKLKAIKVSGPGIDQNNPIVQKAMAQFPGSSYAGAMELPSGGIRQGSVIGPRAGSITGQSEWVDSITAEGQATLRGRPVIVFKIAGVLRTKPNNQQIGDISGFAFLDETAGVIIYESDDVSFDVTEKGDTTTTKMHLVSTIDLP